MRKLSLHILILCGLLWPLLSPAQALPSFKNAQDVTVSTLPNGIRYYLVTNPIDKGYANFALVQQGQTSFEAPRHALQDLPNFTNQAPYRFLATHGIGCGPEGYIRHTSDATIFRFDDVPVHETAVADSVMLLVFDLMRSYPGDQALVVSGDIDASKLPERFYVLSLSVPARTASAAEDSYAWQSSDFIRITGETRPANVLGSIRVSYDLPRTARELMNTAQPALTRLYADILSLVLEKRLRNAFRAAGLPFASLDFRYENSAMTPGDEHLTLQVNTSTYDMEAAATLLGRTLYALDSLGVLPAEYQDARSRIAAEERRASVVREDRQAATERCIRAFLYGETLASAADIYASVLGRSLGAKQELDFFNRYVSALLDPVRNLSFTVLQPQAEVDPRPAFDAFRKGWATDGEPMPVRYRTSSADSLRLGKGARKLKLRAQPVSDPVTGGEFWTFPNGIRVLYKQNKRFEGQFDYMMLLYGGVAGVRDLKTDESPYVGDMLLLSRIAGRSGEEFQDMLAANGITIQAEANAADLRIYGHAPSGRLQLLLKSLTALSNDRQVDPAAWDYYRRSSALRTEQAAHGMAALDARLQRQLARTGPAKGPAALSDDFPQRTEHYFARQFAKVNDGLIILIGDLDATTVQQSLCAYLGNFAVSSGSSLRNNDYDPLPSGWFSASESLGKLPSGPGQAGAHFVLAAQMPFSLDSYIAARIACMMIREELVRRLGEAGASVDVRLQTEIIPVERFTVHISCLPCPAEGLPEGMVPADPETVAAAAREVLGSLGSLQLSPARLKAYKDLLLSHVTALQNDPAYLVEIAAMRQSMGKDVGSGYRDRINGVSADQVTRMLGGLDSGGKLEYIVR
ncbi:MAG: hypothetical protein K6D54_06460 [Bacteroidales bacterium]|nr:hypothetical protein [Bacteroidales bacterium]